MRKEFLLLFGIILMVVPLASADLISDFWNADGYNVEIGTLFPQSVINQIINIPGINNAYLSPTEYKTYIILESGFANGLGIYNVKEYLYNLAWNYRSNRARLTMGLDNLPMPICMYDVVKNSPVGYYSVNAQMFAVVNDSKCY